MYTIYVSSTHIYKHFLLCVLSLSLSVSLSLDIDIDIYIYNNNISIYIIEKYIYICI